jgi:hypothetical protein
MPKRNKMLKIDEFKARTDRALWLVARRLRASNILHAETKRLSGAGGNMYVELLETTDLVSASQMLNAIIRDCEQELIEMGVEPPPLPEQVNADDGS